MPIPFRFAAAAATLALALAGCATTATHAMLTYQTSPIGAQLFEGDKPLGVEPVTRTYAGDGKPGDIRTPDVKAVWPSGASTTFYTLLPPGADNNAVLERPKDAPNLQADLDNAKKYEEQRKLEAARLKTMQKRDIAQASDRCKQQQSGRSLASADDCN
jgi:hypothetical protein